MTTPVNNIHAPNRVAPVHNDPQSSDSEPVTPRAKIQEPPENPPPGPEHYIWQKGWKRA